MKIILDLGHPAHIHLFKHAIWELKKRGHVILITARDKEILLDLLNVYHFEYVILSRSGKSLFGLAIELVKRDYKLFNLAKSFKPDILIGISENITHVGMILKVPSIVFTDTEHAKLSNAITFPFADTIITPFCFKKDLGKKQIRYNGYHELAYLHPNQFTPDPTVLNEIGMNKENKFTVLRFVTWGASHDVGQYGIKNKIGLVKELEKYGRVLISSEGMLDKELEKYSVKVSPEKMHDLLYYASLYLGEGATMATESAILGTPSIYISSLIGTMGNFVELEQKYGLMYNYNDADMAMKKAVELLQKPQMKKNWNDKRNVLLKDKIDVTRFMVWFIENFPKSLKELNDNV